jgi:hypothetical protein
MNESEIESVTKNLHIWTPPQTPPP